MRWGSIPFMVLCNHQDLTVKVLEENLSWVVWFPWEVNLSSKGGGSFFIRRDNSFYYKIRFSVYRKLILKRR